MVAAMPRWCRGSRTRGTPGATADGDTAMTFNGTSGYVAVHDASALDIAGDVSLEAWANPSVLDGATHSIVHKGTGTSSDTWQYRLTLHSTNQWRGCVYVGATGYCVLSPALATTNRWTHLVLTRSAGNLTLFVNGTAVATATSSGSLNSTTGDLAIGRLGSSSSMYFPGAIDEAAVYDHALSAARVAAHYQAAATRAP